MKKLFLILLLFVGISTVSFSQEKSGSRKRKIFRKSHFDKQKKDPNIKHNGTSVKRNAKNKYKVDGDGFVEAKQKRRKKGKKSGLQ
ncbi:MAG TPA: hypothetical protein VFF27_09050 [Bacteroidia bacterium]|jgi:hypothetical protein|nr:hypothetical protein [Bacteroidia bacterium]